MRVFVARIRRYEQLGSTAFRRYFADRRDGPLPVLLLVLTMVAGVVDAVSILSLDRVFVSNMTGNVAFIGFALAGAKGFSVLASFTAFGGFVAGATAAGLFPRGWTRDRARLLGTATLVKLGASLPVVGVAAAIGIRPERPVIYFFIVMLAFSMGVQNATMTRLAVPELTRTTVVTTTLTNLFAEMSGLGWHRAFVLRRSASIGALFAGAVVGATLVLTVNPVWALGFGAILLAGVGAVAVHGLVTDAPWAPFPVLESERVVPQFHVQPGTAGPVM